MPDIVLGITQCYTRYFCQLTVLGGKPTQMTLKLVKNLQPKNQIFLVLALPLTSCEHRENPLTSQTHFPSVQNGIIRTREWYKGQDSNKIRVCESTLWALKDSAHVTDYQK